MSRRLTHTGAVALAALALAATACVGGPSKEEQVADRQAQARWQAGISRWSADMLGALNGISVLLSKADTVNRLRSGEPETTGRLVRFERTLAGCSAAITRLGPSPDALEGVRREALRACRSLESGARLVRVGVATWRARQRHRRGQSRGRGAWRRPAWDRTRANRAEARARVGPCLFLIPSSLRSARCSPRMR